MTAAVNLVGARMLILLANSSAAQAPFQRLIPQLVGMMKDPGMRPLLRLWLELAALSAAGEEPYRAIARQIGDGFYQWLASALQVAEEEDCASMAALAFAVIEGFVFLDAIDESSIIASVWKESVG